MDYGMTMTQAKSIAGFINNSGVAPSFLTQDQYGDKTRAYAVRKTGDDAQVRIMDSNGATLLTIHQYSTFHALLLCCK